MRHFPTADRMDDSLYDEFGNYIGPELSGSEVRTLAAAVRGRL